MVLARRTALVLIASLSLQARADSTIVRPRCKLYLLGVRSPPGCQLREKIAGEEHGPLPMAIALAEATAAADKRMEAAARLAGAAAESEAAAQAAAEAVEARLVSAVVEAKAAAVQETASAAEAAAKERMATELTEAKAAAAAEATAAAEAASEERVAAAVKAAAAAQEERLAAARAEARASAVEEAKAAAEVAAAEQKAATLAATKAASEAAVVAATEAVEARLKGLAAQENAAALVAAKNEAEAATEARMAEELKSAVAEAKAAAAAEATAAAEAKAAERHAAALASALGKAEAEAKATLIAKQKELDAALARATRLQEQAEQARAAHTSAQEQAEQAARECGAVPSVALLYAAAVEEVEAAYTQARADALLAGALIHAAGVAATGTLGAAADQVWAAMLVAPLDRDGDGDLDLDDAMRLAAGALPRRLALGSVEIAVEASMERRTLRVALRGAGMDTVQHVPAAFVLGAAVVSCTVVLLLLGGMRALLLLLQLLVLAALLALTHFACNAEPVALDAAAWERLGRRWDAQPTLSLLARGLYPLALLVLALLHPGSWAPVPPTAAELALVAVTELRRDALDALAGVSRQLGDASAVATAATATAAERLETAAATRATEQAERDAEAASSRSAFEAATTNEVESMQTKLDELLSRESAPPPPPAEPIYTLDPEQERERERLNLIHAEILALLRQRPAQPIDIPDGNTVTPDQPAIVTVPSGEITGDLTGTIVPGPNEPMQPFPVKVVAQPGANQTMKVVINVGLPERGQHADDEALFDPNHYGVRRILISLGATVKEIQAEVIPPEHVRPCAAYVLTNALNGQVRRVPLSARGRSRVPLRALECTDA